MKTLIVVLLLCAVLVGCDCPPNQNFRASGYVRNVWHREGVGGGFFVTFEHDSSEIVVFRFANQPAVWAGEHYQIGYHYYFSDMDVFDWAKRDQK